MDWVMDWLVYLVMDWVMDWAMYLVMDWVMYLVRD